jgi:hypothetical protein
MMTYLGESAARVWSQAVRPVLSCNGFRVPEYTAKPLSNSFFSVDSFTMLSAARLYGLKWDGDWWIEKGTEGSERGLMEVQCFQLWSNEKVKQFFSPHNSLFCHRSGGSIKEKKVVILEVNKYMVMGPHGARYHEWRCWLVAALLSLYTERFLLQTNTMSPFPFGYSVM